VCFRACLIGYCAFQRVSDWLLFLQSVSDWLLCVSGRLPAVLSLVVVCFSVSDWLLCVFRACLIGCCCLLQIVSSIHAFPENEIL
jgi:hypothetical protein